MTDNKEVFGRYHEGSLQKIRWSLGGNRMVPDKLLEDFWDIAEGFLADSK